MGAVISALCEDHIDHAKVQGLRSRHKMVSVHRLIDLLNTMAGVFCQNGIQPLLDLLDMLCPDLDIAGCPLETLAMYSRLMDHDLRMRQRHPFAPRPACQQKRAETGRLPTQMVATSQAI